MKKLGQFAQERARNKLIMHSEFMSFILFQQFVTLPAGQFVMHVTLFLRAACGAGC